MIEFFGLLVENDYALVVAIAAGLTIIWLVYKAWKAHINLSVKVVKVFESVEKMQPIIEGWDKVTSDVETLKTDVGVLKNDVARLDNKVTGLDDKFTLLTEQNRVFIEQNRIFIQQIKENNMAGAKSPLKLNETGQRANDIIDGAKFADEYSKLVPITKETPYAIQIACFDFASYKLPEIVTKKQLDIIENAAFKVGVTPGDVFYSIGFPLRDKILAEKGMPIEQFESQSD